MDLWGIVREFIAIVFARSKGYHEQAGRQDRDARTQVARALQAFQERLQREEDRRFAMQRGNTVRVQAGESLTLVECAKHVWCIVDALRNPVLNRRVPTKVEHDLSAIMGERYIEHLKRRPEAPKWPQSLSEMHDWLSELVQGGVVCVDLTKPREQTSIDAIFDAERDPKPVAYVRHKIEKMITTVLR